jgi:hypothetical protein
VLGSLGLPSPMRVVIAVIVPCRPPL